MFFKKSIFKRLWVIAGMLGAVANVQAVIFKGVVSDSVNGMLIDSVKVSMGAASTYSDSKGAFTLDVSSSAIEKYKSQPYFSSLKWDAATGTFLWSGHENDVSITVRSIAGDRVAHTTFEKSNQGATFSLAQLPQGVYLVTFKAQGIHTTYKISYLKNQWRGSFSALPLGNSPLLKKAAGQADYTLAFSKNNFDTLLFGVAATSLTNINAKLKSPYPLRNILHLFSDPSVPAKGPSETVKDTPKCTATPEVKDLIGGQLKRHDFIMIGETHRRINVVIGGKVVWHYDTENDWEDDDVWVLSNGNVLHAHMKYIEEISPKKEVVWYYKNPAGTEIHTCQPIGVDRVLFLQNETGGARIMLYNKVTKTYEVDHLLKEFAGGVHGQCRRMRMTHKGSYVLGCMSTGTFHEYDKDFNLVWSKKVGSIWGGVPLKNGNFLSTNEGARTAQEMNRAGEKIWQASLADVQTQLDKLAPGMTKVTSTQTSERLSNGNTVFFTRDCDSKKPQAIEITPDKEVVWILQEWQNLGDAVSMQFLDEPGYPEIPGATNH